MGRAFVGGRMVNPLRWCLARRKRVALTLFGVPLVLLNFITYRHARAFTHYASSDAAVVRAEAPSRWQKLGVLFNGITVPRPENRSSPADHGLPFTTHTIPGD